MKSARSGSSWSGSEANRTFLNTGSARFADVSYISGLGSKDDGRALAVTDWDGDGDLDLWTQNRTAPRLRLMRNNSATENRFVSFHLTGGRKSNRDAIGARLKLVLSEGGELVQTLRAGNGFLSQSSKWLHFGLGPKATPTSLQITWPDGSKEILTNIAPNTRCRIHQGAGLTPVTARKISPLAARHAGSSLPQEPPLQGVIPGKIPLPDFRYTPAGSETPLPLTAGNKPLLIVVFSGSCKICATELAGITGEEKRILSSNLDVLALSIDGLAGADPQASRLLLEKAGFPFTSGAIKPASADHLRLLLDSLYDFPAPFAVPLSLLLDEERRLFAVYRGAASLQLVLHDAGFSKAGADQLRDLSVPFPGRWFTDSITPSALAEFVANPFYETFPLQGVQYLKYAMIAATTVDQKSRLRQQISLGCRALARHEEAAGRHSTAEIYLQETIAVDPENFEAHMEYGTLLETHGKVSEADSQFRKALELRPNNEAAKTRLSHLLQR